MKVFAKENCLPDDSTPEYAETAFRLDSIPSQERVFITTQLKKKKVCTTSRMVCLLRY